jgi:hypothetical protein
VGPSTPHNPLGLQGRLHFSVATYGGTVQPGKSGEVVSLPTLTCCHITLAFVAARGCLLLRSRLVTGDDEGAGWESRRPS